MSMEKTMSVKRAAFHIHDKTKSEKVRRKDEKSQQKQKWKSEGESIQIS